MNVHERRKHIESYIEENGKADIEELTGKLHVSTMTIRRDLTYLEKEGSVIRTHGGAVSPHFQKGERPYVQKEQQYLFEKQLIAEEALERVKPFSTIMLDSGTTTLELAKRLSIVKGLTVVTNDIFIATELLYADIHVIVAGGELQREVGAMYGSHAQDLIRSLNVDQFFLGGHAVDLDQGVTAPTLEKARVKQLMIEAAQETWLVADSSKFHQTTFAHVCHLETLQGIISDAVMSGVSEQPYRERFIVAGNGGRHLENRGYSG